MFVEKAKKQWSIGVSIPVPRACKARTLPIELMPQKLVVRLPGIEPGSSAWEAPMITITLQAPLEAADGVAHRPKKPPRAERKKGNVIPDGTRTHNLRLRKPTPCPFGL